MTAAEHLLDKVVAWAAVEPNVRRLVLVGSRARSAQPDDLADIDLQIYSVTSAACLEENRWASMFGELWVCVPDEYRDDELRVPTRLVIFEGGLKIDFAFYPAGALSMGIRSGLAHRVLVDKDPFPMEASVDRRSTSGRVAPTAAEFRRVVEEFWFETYHVAKYLARNDLWLAKSRDWATKGFLLALICWHEQFTRGRVVDFDCEGRRTTISPDTWHELGASFSGFRREESWDAALATMALFRRLGTETAEALGYVYPAEIDRNLSGFILGLRRREG